MFKQGDQVWYKSMAGERYEAVVSKSFSAFDTSLQQTGVFYDLVLDLPGTREPYELHRVRATRVEFREPFKTAVGASS